MDERDQAPIDSKAGPIRAAQRDWAWLGWVDYAFCFSVWVAAAALFQPWEEETRVRWVHLGFVAIVGLPSLLLSLAIAVERRKRWPVALWPAAAALILPRRRVSRRTGRGRG